MEKEEGKVKQRMRDLGIEREGRDEVEGRREWELMDR